MTIRKGSRPSRLAVSSPSRGQLAEAGVPPSFMRRSKNSNSQSVTDWDLLSPPDKQIPSPRCDWHPWVDTSMIDTSRGHSQGAPVHGILSGQVGGAIGCGG